MITVNPPQVVKVFANTPDGPVNITMSNKTPPAFKINFEGFQGPPGPEGPQGISGAGITHTQSVAQSEWVINHNGAREYINIKCFTDGGVSIEGDLLVVDSNQCRVFFNVPISGYAYIT